MADGDENQQGSESEQGSGDGKGGGALTIEQAMERIAALENENQQVTTVAKGAAKEAENAKAYVASLMSTLQNAAENGNGPLADGGEGDAESIHEKFSRDPLSFMDQHYQARTAPLVAQNQEQVADQNREIFILRSSQEKLWEGGPTVWGKYGEEIDKFMGKFPANVRAGKDAYAAAVRWVRSQHLDDEVKERLAAIRDAEKRPFLEGASAGGGGGKKVNATLSDREKEIARKLGVKEEDYLKYRDNATGEEA